MDLSMDYIQKIFKRAKVKNVVDHLLYGYEPDMDISVVYMEIGFQAELLFMQEVYHNSERGHLLRGTAVRDIGETGGN